MSGGSTLPSVAAPSWPLSPNVRPLLSQARHLVPPIAAVSTTGTARLLRVRVTLQGAGQDRALKELVSLGHCSDLASPGVTLLMVPFQIFLLVGGFPSADIVGLKPNVSVPTVAGFKQLSASKVPVTFRGVCHPVGRAPTRYKVASSLLEDTLDHFQIQQLPGIIPGDAS